MMRSTIRILMDSVPEDIDLDERVTAMEAIDHVEQVHHIHIWQLDEHHRAMEAHVVVPVNALDQTESIKNALRARLASDFDVMHSTLELETENMSPHATQVIVNH